MLLLSLLIVADTAIKVLIPVAPAETVSVSLQGAGQPVVFIPGLFGSAFGFRRVTPPLVDAGYWTVIVEPLGIGRSARPKEADYSLAAQAERLAAVLDSLDIAAAFLVPHSVGGGIAFRLALLRPDLVAGIVSIEGGPAEEATTPGFRFLMRFSRLIRLFGGADLLRRQVYSNLVASSGDPAWVTEEVVEGYTADAARDLSATLDAFRGMTAAEEPWSLAARMSDIASPTVLLVGGAEHDSAVPEEEVDLLRESLPTFVVDTIPEVGHFIFEERPSAVVDAVRRLHLKVLPAAPGSTDRDSRRSRG